MASAISSGAWIILLRHASREHRLDREDREDRLTRDGVGEARAVAVTLREHLCNQADDAHITPGLVWTGHYAHTRESARIVSGTLGITAPTEHLELDPVTFWPHPGAATKSLVERLRATLNGPEFKPDGVASRPNAIVVVGHQPQLSWIAKRVLGKPVPVTRSEAICLQVCGQWLLSGRTRGNRVGWTIEPRDDKTLGEIRDKIRSKMDIAKVLGGFIFATLAILLDTGKIKPLIDEQLLWHGINLGYNAALLAATLFILAGTLYMATLFAYDRLLMPTRFWTEDLDAEHPGWLVARPPSSSTYILYLNMMRIWNWMFLPATVCVISGFVIFTLAVFRPGSFLSLSSEVTLVLTVLVLAAGVLGFLAYYRRFGTRLGTED